MIARDQTNLGPHVGIIKFHIYVHRLLPDGSLDTEIVECTDLLNDHKITKVGQIHVTGYDRWNCVEKVKNILEGLSKE